MQNVGKGIYRSQPTDGEDKGSLLQKFRIFRTHTFAKVLYFQLILELVVDLGVVIRRPGQALVVIICP